MTTEDENAGDDRRDRIRELNDRLRYSGLGGRVFITRGIDALGAHAAAKILAAVRRFDGFTPENDPYGEHDFGNLEVEGRTIFFKIDYYDPTETMHSEDAADPEKTRRVLTIMLAEEY